MNEAAYLLDSNILIYLLEGTSLPALSAIQRCSPGEVATSAVAYAEVMRKVPDDEPEKLADVEALFSVVAVLPFDVEAARSYRHVPFKRGTFDRLIAAHALSLGLTFVTNNERDFADFPDLRVENWARE